MAITLAQARTCQRHVLSRLSDEHYAPLLPLLDIVETKLKEVLYEQGAPIHYVYFPCDCAHSCILYMEDGAGIEIGTTGNESFTGTELLLNAKAAIEMVVCQVPGRSLRMNADDFRRAVDTHPTFRDLLQRSAQGYLTQVSQSVACNRLHSMDMRFARWMLITHDRVQSDEFPMTQEFIASMLGVHRPTVSLVAGMFQQAGIIKYSRGKLRVIDRVRLEEASCECYAAVRKQFDRLLGVSHG